MLYSCRGLSERLDFVQICWFELPDGSSCCVDFRLNPAKLMLNILLSILNYNLILCTMGL